MFKNLILIAYIVVLTSSCTSAPIVTTPTLLENPVQPTTSYMPTVLPTFTQPSISTTPSIQVFYDDPSSSCQLPCWWGINPGETTWTDADRLLSPSGKIVSREGASGLLQYYFVFKPPEKSENTTEDATVGFVVKDGIIQTVAVNSNLINKSFDPSLTGILTQIGVPDGIWLRLYPVSIDGVPHYEMILFYKNAGLVWISGEAQVQDSLMEICPQDAIQDSYPGLVLWSPGAIQTFQDLNSPMFRAAVPDVGDFSEISLLSTNIKDAEGFFNLYQHPDSTECISVKLHK